MRNALLMFALVLFGFLTTAAAQSTAQTTTIRLEQTPGKFTIQSLTLEEGTYQFEIANVGVNHELGFVLAPKGKPQPEHHIKAAYVQKTVKDGETAFSQPVQLKKGEYIYFCPLNPTEQYPLTVH